MDTGTKALNLPALPFALPEAATFIMVDDNEDDIYLTRRTILREGASDHFFAQRNPRELLPFLSALTGQGFQQSGFILLLDLNMPQESGLDTLRRIRAHRALHSLPVVMFSGSEHEADRRQALGAGCDAFVVKPFSTEQFFAALEGAPRLSAGHADREPHRVPAWGPHG